MDNKILEQIQARVELDEDMQDFYSAYNDIDNLKWEPPSTLLKDWVRVRKSTAGHDALKQMANIFDTHNPKWEILPLGEADVDRAERLETWLEYHAAKANMMGEMSPFRKGLHNSGKFNRVIYHVDYLPYWLPADKKKWSKEQKANVSNGPFCFTAHDPRIKFYEMGKYGLKWISSVVCVAGQLIIDDWSIYEGSDKMGRQIKSGLAKIKALMDDDEECYFIYVDYVSNEKREVAAFKTTQENIDEFCDLDAGNAITILSDENELGFIPYAVATGDSDALLHSMHVSGAWENQNLIETIVDSSVLRRAFFPLLKHTSITGKDLDISFDGSQDAVELGQGEDASVLVPPAIDAGMQQLMGMNTQRMGETVGIKNLGLLDIAGNVQFSTVQAQVQLMLTNLQPYKRTAEKALAQLGVIMFKWLQKSGKSEIAYRSAKRVRKQGQEKGEGIMIGPDDFDPEAMIITCELLSNSPTDKQQLVNMYSALKQAGAQISWGELLERLQLGNPEMLKQEWLDEQIEGAALQDFVAKMQAKLQLEVQAQTMQMQAQMQQAQMAQQQQGEMAMAQQEQQANPSQKDPVQSGGQENNPAAGGQPQMMNNPGLTRNNVRNPG